MWELLDFRDSIKIDNMRVLGISADRNSLGVAEYEFDSRLFDVRKMCFFDLYEYVKERKEDIYLVRIRVEPVKKIADAPLENYGTAVKLAEMCDRFGIVYDMIYCSKDDVLEHYIFNRDSGFTGRTNQAMRNAGQLLFEYLKQ
jgi:hypothetical protein